MLLTALGAVFVKGFKEAIGIAVAIVAVYLALNVFVLAYSFIEIFRHPEYVPRWTNALRAQHGNPVMMLAFALLVFPKLALGLSGFETGVAVMPLVSGIDPEYQEAAANRRSSHERILIGRSVVTTLFIPAEAFAEGGEASGRALAYLAHHHHGEFFGTVYDISTMAILWFAGASATLPRGRLTLPFGPSPWGSRIVDGEPFHDGIDLATFCGDRIVAAHGGTVLAAGRKYDRFMGWVGDLEPYLDRLEKKHLWSTLPIVVVIDDGNGYRSIYAHFGKVVVKKGAAVKAGQLLGYEGPTGRASGCHLHYGLFSPAEIATFGIEPSVVKRMKLPDRQIARIDPMLVIRRAAQGAEAQAERASPGT